MLISHSGKIIRMDSNTIRESDRNAEGVRLLHLESSDRVAAAGVMRARRKTKRRQPDTIKIKGIPSVTKQHRNYLTGVLRSDTLLG
jgi:DNA gyrase/topoisomerase IV subunit A